MKNVSNLVITILIVGVVTVLGITAVIFTDAEKKGKKLLGSEAVQCFSKDNIYVSVNYKIIEGKVHISVNKGTYVVFSANHCTSTTMPK